MELLNKLNENQKKSVLHTDGPLLILAGAGSGKTRVITYRIAYLIHEKKISPYNIMAVTFTNKAAEEMRKRIVEIIGMVGESVFIKTFHSSAAYILRRYGELNGIPRSFSIYDSRDQEVLIKEILLEMRLDPKKIKPSMIASKISEIKDKAHSFDESHLVSSIPNHSLFNFQEVFKRYQERLQYNGALDFNDLLIKTVEILQNNQDVLRELQSRWKYYMIDEYQDTNHAQYLICKTLSSSSRNICVVGDDDQSIYSWRGADIENILNFERDYIDTKVIVLEENYRSTSPILEAASLVIQNNQNRKEKTLRAWKGDGEPVTWCQANNEYGEAEYVINNIISLKGMEGWKNSDFAIFYRTNAQSRVFEEYLRRENISYKIVGGLKFYDRKEIKDILSYLKIISNPNDSISLLRIINTPSRGIGSVTIAGLRDIAKSDGISEWDVIKRGYISKGRTHKGIDEFCQLVQKGIQFVKEIPENLRLSEFIDMIIDESGYRRSLQEDDSIDGRVRLENVDEFMNSVNDYEMRNGNASLDEFLQDISLLTSEENPLDESQVESDYVTLMTVHNAKGLEFSVVFLTGMEEDIFPHINSINSSNNYEGIEEERRLCYVGITRAMNRIFLTNAQIRRRFNGTVCNNPSRFIFEIPERLINKTEHYDSSHVSPGFTGRWHHHKSEYGNDFSLPDELDSRQGCSFNIRDMVMHPKYGVGRITEIKGKGDNVKFTIKFGSGDRRVFLEKYTPLEKIV
ncbi:MAG: UvrD-helicase domain-containing protein [Spirochaetota bacterium]|nr:UvrD-helicase domain-containing protein [Spirochaetota bacterium]